MTLEDEIEDRILEKAEYIESATEILTDKRSLDEATYREDREQRDIVEREFQTAIEACIDIASLLCRSVEADVPDHSAETFALLAEENVISERSARHMQEAVGFRNVLAHRYGDRIDDSLVYQSLHSDLDWFLLFLNDVRAHLEAA